MRKKFFSFISTITKIERIPFFRGAIKIISGSAMVIDITESFAAAANSSLPITHRTVSTVRGTCCSGAIVTSYFSSISPSPQIKAAFTLCCYGFNRLYLISDGDIKVAALAIYNSTRTK